MIERTFIEQGIKKLELEQFLKNELVKAGFTKLEIFKTPLVTRIVVNVTRPGLAIGKAGQNIRQLTEAIETDYKIENPQLEIRQIEVPELDAQAMADRVKALIERGFSWRSVTYRAIKDVMAAGAQGCELVASGKLAGKGGRKRKRRILEGYMKKVGEQASWVDYAKAAAYPKAGAIGIKVRIVKPNTVFPDKIDVKAFCAGKTAAEEGAVAAAEAAAEKAEGKTEIVEPKKDAEEKKEENPKAEAKKEGEKAEAKPKAEKKETKKAEEKKPKVEVAPSEKGAEAKKADKKETKKAGPKAKEAPAKEAKK